VVNTEPIKLRKQATSFVQIPGDAYGDFASFLSGQDGRGRASLHGNGLLVQQGSNLLVAFFSSYHG